MTLETIGKIKSSHVMVAHGVRLMHETLTEVAKENPEEAGPLLEDLQAIHERLAHIHDALQAAAQTAYVSEVG